MIPIDPESWRSMDEVHIWRDRGDLCPSTYFDTTCGSGTRKLDFHFAPAIAGLISAGVSVVGCALMLLAYYRFHDFRTGSRRVATYLALSNFFLAASSALGFINNIWYEGLHLSGSDSNSSCLTYSVICTVQSFATWTSALASFTWTTILAVFLYLVLVKKSILAANRPCLWTSYWSLSVFIPLIALAPILATGYLGYSPYANGGGCFITTAVNSSYHNISFEFIPVNKALIATIKSIEMLSYVLVVGLFTAILCHLRKPSPSTLDEEVSHLDLLHFEFTMTGKMG